MNAGTTSEHESMALVEIIQFKWLMAHEGRHVHVERMQTDRDYAVEQLTWAEASANAALSSAAASLRAALQLTD